MKNQKKIFKQDMQNFNFIFIIAQTLFNEQNRIKIQLH